MAAYAVFGDIESEFKDIDFTANTVVTSAEVTEFIEQEEAIINGKLGTRYVVPLTGVESLKIAKRISIGMTVCRVQDIVEIRTGDTKTDKGIQRPKICREAFKLLEDILANRITLSDATLISTDDGFSSGNVDNNVEATFKRNTDQW